MSPGRSRDHSSAERPGKIGRSLIIDSHAHIFPWLGGESGYGSAKLHKLYIQKGMVGHPQPYRRFETEEIVDEPDMLWDLKTPGASGYREAELDIAPYGRVTWVKNRTRYYLQFMPPWLDTNECPPELLVALMDHAGIDVAVLQNDHIYGSLNDYFAKAVKAFPERFIGTVQVDETIADHDEQIALLHRGVQSGLRGLFYATFAFFRTDFGELFDAPRFARFWSEVQALRLPTYFDLAALPHSTREDYLEQLKRFASWCEKWPDIRCLLVQAIPTGLFLENGRLRVPPLIGKLARERGLLLELTLPISYGRSYEYPYAELTGIVQGLYDTVGSTRLAWGSDIPNVERYCTYQQSLNYLSRTCNFLSDEELKAILGENLRDFLSAP